MMTRFVYSGDMSDIPASPVEADTTDVLFSQLWDKRAVPNSPPIEAVGLKSANGLPIGAVLREIPEKGVIIGLYEMNTDSGEAADTPVGFKVLTYEGEGLLMGDTSALLYECTASAGEFAQDRYMTALASVTLDDDEYEYGSVIFSPSNRNRGLGTLLYKLTFNIAHEIGASTVALMHCNRLSRGRILRMIAKREIPQARLQTEPNGTVNFFFDLQ